MAATRAVDQGALASAEALLRRADAVASGEHRFPIDALLLRISALSGQVDRASVLGGRLLDSARSPAERADIHLEIARAALTAGHWPVAEDHAGAVADARSRGRVETGPGHGDLGPRRDGPGRRGDRAPDRRARARTRPSNPPARCAMRSPRGDRSSPAGARHEGRRGRVRRGASCRHRRRSGAVASPRTARAGHDRLVRDSRDGTSHRSASSGRRGGSARARRRGRSPAGGRARRAGRSRPRAGRGPPVRGRLSKVGPRDVADEPDPPGDGSRAARRRGCHERGGRRRGRHRRGLDERRDRPVGQRLSDLAPREG